MLNKVTIIGRLTKDPELKYTKSNVPVVSFSIANEDDFRNKDGEKDVDFFDVVAWRGTAEMVAKYCAKGRLVAVCGRLKTRTWQDNDGNNRKVVEIKADEVYFLGDNKRNDAEAQSAPAPAYADFEELAEDDGELPF